MNAGVAPSVPGSDRAPGTLRGAVLLLFVEAAAFVLLTGYLLVMDVIAHPTNVGVAVALTVFTALCAGAVAAMARALRRRASGARGPAIVMQLMLAVLASYLMRGGIEWLGVPVLVIALTAGVLLLLPPTTQALGLHRT